MCDATAAAHSRCIGWGNKKSSNPFNCYFLVKPFNKYLFVLTFGLRNYKRPVYYQAFSGGYNKGGAAGDVLRYI